MLEQRPMIGRAHELERLETAVNGLHGGEGSCVLVTGEAGIGKSRLVAHALERASLRAYTGAARSSVTEPYGAVAQVLRQCLRQTPDLPEACGRLTPYLAPLLPEIGNPAEDAGEATLVEALLGAFTEIGSRGEIAVVLDDLQWADEATLVLVPRLAAGLRNAPLLLVVVMRDEVPADMHRLRRLRAELRRVSEPVELPLKPFDREDTGRLATLVSGDELDDALVTAVHERAQGIPFYVEQLAATLALDGRRAEPGGLPLPESVLDAVLLRTEALSLDARNALETAAVVGQRFDVERVPGVRGDALAEALTAGFLLEDGPGRLAFRHALVREAVYQAIPWTRRRSLHARVARVFEDTEQSAAERANHWLGAGEIDHARSALAEAAGYHASVYAYGDAAKLYERALDLQGGDETARFGLLERLATCSELAGDLAGSARAWREVIDGQRRCGEVEKVAEAQLAIGRVLALRGSTERAIAAWFAAADGFAACGQRESAARAQLAAAGVLQGTARLRPALVAIESALADLPPDASRELYSRARSLQGTVLGKLGDTEQALESVQVALSEALSEGHAATAAAAYQALAVVHEMSGDFGKATEAFEFAIDYCATAGVTAIGAVCSGCLCHVLRQRGEWRRSLALAKEMLDDPLIDEVNRGVAAAVASQIHACRGERRLARTRAMEAAPVMRQHSVIGAEAECSWTFARLDMLEASEQTALDHCREILRRLEETEDRHYSLNGLAWSAGVFAACGEEEDVNRVVRALTTIASEYGNREALAMLARALGELARLRRDPGEAVEHFRRALDLHREIELPHDRAELLVSGAAAAQEAGLDDLAREWLTDARLHARRLGARPLQAVAERQLASLGSAEPTPAGAAGLTARQLQVIRRVAEGRTNREIAAELFLSVRTVDMHVRHSLIALGCRSRLDAARRAGDLGLLEHA